MTDNLHNSTELTSNAKNDPIEIEYYSQSLAAFYNSSLEIEKTYIILSSAAIAFISQLSLIQNSLLSLIKILALIFYFACIYFSINSFELNKNYIISKLNNDENLNKRKTQTNNNDKLNKLLFLSAISLTIALIAINTFPTLLDVEKNLSKEKSIVINNNITNCTKEKN